MQKGWRCCTGRGVQTAKAKASVADDLERTCLPCPMRAAPACLSRFHLPKNVSLSKFLSRLHMGIPVPTHPTNTRKYNCRKSVRLLLATTSTLKVESPHPRTPPAATLQHASEQPSSLAWSQGVYGWSACGSGPGLYRESARISKFKRSLYNVVIERPRSWNRYRSCTTSTGSCSVAHECRQTSGLSLVALCSEQTSLPFLETPAGVRRQAKSQE